MNSIPDSVLNILVGFDSPINLQELIHLLSTPEPQGLFIKNRNLQYVYATSFFIGLMGLKNGAEIAGMEDTMLCSDKALTDRYQDYDKKVLETGMPIVLSDTIQPKYNDGYVNIMEGMEYPLYGKSGRPEYVLGIVTPKMRPMKLDWNTLFNLDGNKLENLLSKKGYTLKSSMSQIRFSRRELQVLIALIQGKRAGETADTLNLKQSTVESYIKNIKNKIGVNSKSELIHYLTDNRLLEQIIL